MIGLEDRQALVRGIDTAPVAGATHSPEQIDLLARTAAAMATEHAGRGNVQAVLLSKDQQTMALKQAFGISEVGVQDALNRPPLDAGQATAGRDGRLPAPPPAAPPPLAAMAR